MDDTLEIRVDGVLWTEVPSLYPAGPHDRVYVVRIADDAIATVDLRGRGARRAAADRAGERAWPTTAAVSARRATCAAHALTLLPQRPLGVSGVDNPLGPPPAPRPGAAGRCPDQRAAHRADPGPGGVAGRLRGLRAELRRDREGPRDLDPGPTGPVVYLTVAGPDGAQVPPDTISDLLAALDWSGTAA